METPGPHFHYDFGDPSVNLGIPPCSSMFIVELEESAVAMSLLGSAELIIVRRVSGWLEIVWLA